MCASVQSLAQASNFYQICHENQKPYCVSRDPWEGYPPVIRTLFNDVAPILHSFLIIDILGDFVRTSKMKETVFCRFQARIGWQWASPYYQRFCDWWCMHYVHRHVWAWFVRFVLCHHRVCADIGAAYTKNIHVQAKIVLTWLLMFDLDILQPSLLVNTCTSSCNFLEFSIIKFNISSLHKRVWYFRRLKHN